VSDAVVSVGVEQYLNQTSGETLREHVRGLLGAEPAAIVLDFSGTRLVNSIGVSFLLEIIEMAQHSGTRLEFVRVSPDISDLFQLLGIAGRVPVS
jgi:anti-anti-sigma regulatory factor